MAIGIDVTHYVTAADLSPAFPGQLADLSPADIRSFVAETAVTVGTVVCQGTSAGQCAVVASGVADCAVGVVIRLNVLSPSDLDGSGKIPAGEDVSVLNKGRIWVLADDSPSVGDRGYTEYSGSPGYVSDQATTALDTRAQVRFLSEKNSDDLALVEVDFQNVQG